MIGALLFLGFLVLAGTAVARAARRAGPPGRGAAFAATLGFAIFFIHGLADWLWQLPALGVLAFALLAMATRVGPEGALGAAVDPLPPRRRMIVTQRLAPGTRVLGRAVVAIVVLVISVSLSLPAIAARDTASAYRVSAGDPQLAIARFRRAGSLNFLRADAPLAEALVAAAIGRSAQARRDFTIALAREPDNWFILFERSIEESNAGDRTHALVDIAAAERLNPHQPVVGEVAPLVRAGRHIDAAAVGRELEGQLAVRLRATG